MTHGRVRRGVLAWAVAGLLGAASAAAAEESRGITVSAGGSVPVAPVALQFSFPVEARGDDVAKAAEALETKIKAVVEKLKGLGVDEKSVRPDLPQVKRKGGDPREAAMRAMSNRLKKKKADEGADGKEVKKEPVTVSQGVTARLPLSQKEGTALFVEVEQMKVRIKAAGLVEKEKPEGGEESEEEQMVHRYSSGEDNLEDGFLFLYYAPAPPKAEREATVKAVEEARRAAEAAAQAAGKGLGDPVSVEIVEGGMRGVMQEMFGGYDPYNRVRRMPGFNPQERNALLGNMPDGLKVGVVAKVTYAWK